MAKRVVVFGATGSQGGAIASELLKSPSKFNVVAITRDASSNKAKILKSKGAEIVTADQNDLESLVKAVRGTNVIFGVTDFLTAHSVEKETTQGLNILHAAETTLDTLEAYIWSNLPDARVQHVPFQNVIHFNAKNDVAKEIRKRESVARKLIEVRLGPYFQNLLKAPQVYGPQKHDDGSWELQLPCSANFKLPFTSVQDLGKLTAIIVDDLPKFVGKVVSVVSERVTPIEMLNEWNKAVGKSATFKSLSTEEFTSRLRETHQFPDFLAVALAENLSMYRDDPEAWTGDANFALRDLVSDLQTWKDYVKNEDWSGYPGL